VNQHRLLIGQRTVTQQMDTRRDHREQVAQVMQSIVENRLINNEPLWHGRILSDLP
jgi:hypothetical protein